MEEHRSPKPEGRGSSPLWRAKQFCRITFQVRRTPLLMENRLVRVQLRQPIRVSGVTEAHRPFKPNGSGSNPEEPTMFLMPLGVIGNTSGFDPDILGSSPGGVTKYARLAE